MADRVLWGRSLLPQNATPLMRAFSEAAAEAVDRLPRGETIPDAISWQRCDARLLPWLAWEWSVDEWVPSWPEATKRGAIADAWRVHAMKGTIGALKVAIDRLGYGALVSEWFEYGGGPFLFRLVLNSPEGREWRAAEFRSLTRAALATKNVRSHLEEIDLRTPGPKAGVFVGALVKTALVVRPSVEPITHLSGQASSYVGAVIRSRIRVKPKR